MNGVLVEFIRFHPILENDNLYYGEKFYNRRTINIDLKQINISSGYNTRTKRNIKKALKNNLKIYYIKDIQFIESFKKMYINLMNAKNTSQEYFFSETYFNKILLHENCHLVSAVNNEGKVIAACTFFTEVDIAEYHLSASTNEGKECGATNLIIDCFANQAKKYGISSLYLGGGMSDSIEDSLFMYKRGFSKIEKNYYIGKKIHDTTVYEELKNDLVEKGKIINSNRILFYR